MKPYYEDTKAGITIYNCDCMELIPQLGKVDLMLTDPPYGIGFAAQPTTAQRRRGNKPQAWDNETVDISTLLMLGEYAIIWGGNYYTLPPKRGWLCWFKPDAPPSMGSFELAWTNIDQNTRLFCHSIAATNPERVGHPTQKPLSVMTWCVMLSPKAKTVIDPFLGSGTTLRACKDLGRRGIGVEIEERYCEIAARRLQQEVLAI